MLVAQQFPLHRQRLTVHGFGLGKVALREHLRPRWSLSELATSGCSLPKTFLSIASASRCIASASASLPWSSRRGQARLLRRIGHVRMLVAQQFPLHCQRLALHRFGLGQLALMLKHDGQVVERQGHVWMLVAQQLSLHRQRLAMHGLGLGQLALIAEHEARLSEHWPRPDARCPTVSSASPAPRDAWSRPRPACLGREIALARLLSDGGHFRMLIAQAAFSGSPAPRAASPRPSLIIRQSAKYTFADDAAQFRLDIRLIFQVFADALGGLVQDLPQHLRVAPSATDGPTPLSMSVRNCATCRLLLASVSAFLRSSL